MTDNFFTDNFDLQFHLERIDLEEIVDTLESGYRNNARYPAAPRNYADAKDNYQRLLQLLGEICATEVAPRAAEADEEGVRLEEGRVVYAAPIRKALQTLSQAGLMGAMLPWEVGGLNLPGTVLQMMVEIVSRADAALMTVFGLQEISATIAEYGSEDMKADFLPRFAQGEVTGAMVLTEPDAGSDLGSIQTRATFDEETGWWTLNGVKRFITNGCAGVHLVLARSEEGSDDARGLSLFLVEVDDTVRIRRTENKMGLHASPTCEVQYCDTPAQLIGKRRFGLIRYAMSLMNGARLAVAAQALGIAEAAYREARQYARKRAQFGHTIDQFPAVYRMLLSMRGEIEATRALIYETARWVDLKRAAERQLDEAEEPTTGQRQRVRQLDRLTGVLTPLVKYTATEMGNRVVYQAMQVHGGTGYMREFNVERHYRDMRVTSIYEGTSQLQVVAATGGLLNHSLDPLLDEWAALDYGPDLAPLTSKVEQATQKLQQCIDSLRGCEEQALVDYYAVDLVKFAVGVTNCWLMLRDGRTRERKQQMARVYIAESLPRIQASLAALQACDPAAVRAREPLLATPL